MTDIMALGEVLIDLTQTGTDEKGIPQFAAFPGGAPANVAVAAARLGGRTGFIGMVGKDSFGSQLRQTLLNEGVDTEGLRETEESPTTLAIVSVDAAGERSFAFYRQPGADTRLTPGDAIRALDESSPKILHFGSLSLTTEPSRTAALAAVEHAKAGGVLVSYDPNYRPALWSDEEKAIRWMKEPLGQVDILKVSDEELVMLTGTEDLEEGSKMLADYGIRLVLVTLGGAGVFYRFGSCSGRIPGESVTVSDTNGAGDTFLGAVLSKLSKAGESKSGCGEEGAGHAGCVLNENVLSEEALREILQFANRAAAKTCSRPGAIPAMPTLEEMAGNVSVK